MQPIVLTTGKTHNRKDTRRRVARVTRDKRKLQHEMVFDPYDYIYGRYEFGEDALQQLYLQHPLMDATVSCRSLPWPELAKIPPHSLPCLRPLHRAAPQVTAADTPESCIFRSSDRVKLILSIMGANQRAKGAGIDLMKMMATRCTLKVLPVCRLLLPLPSAHANDCPLCSRAGRLLPAAPPGGEGAASTALDGVV